MADRFVIDKKDRVDLTFDFSDVLVDEGEEIFGVPTVTIPPPAGITTPLATYGTIGTDSTGKKVIAAVNNGQNAEASDYFARVEITSNTNTVGLSARKTKRSFIVTVRENL